MHATLGMEFSLSDISFHHVSRVKCEISMEISTSNLLHAVSGSGLVHFRVQSSFPSISEVYNVDIEHGN